jgi:uncharacterized membrane protein
MLWGTLFGLLFFVPVLGMAVEKITPDKAVEALSKFGGSVLKSSLSKEAEQQLQQELQGQSAAGT